MEEGGRYISSTDSVASDDNLSIYSSYTNYTTNYQAPSNLRNILYDKNAKIGSLEAQNSLLKLKLRLTLREIDLKNNKVYIRKSLINLTISSYNRPYRFLQTLKEKGI